MAGRNKLTLVSECPWRDGECLSAECAERGPLYRIGRAEAASVVIGIARGLADGGGHALSLDEDGRALCPRAALEPVAELMSRHALKDRAELYIEGDVAYCRAAKKTEKVVDS